MNCVFVPAGARWSELDFDRKRKGFDVALQWQPNERTDLWLNVLQSDYQMNWIEHSAWLEDSAYSIIPAAGTSFTFDDEGVFQSGQMVSNSWVPTGPISISCRPRARACRRVPRRAPRNSIRRPPTTH